MLRALWALRTRERRDAFRRQAAHHVHQRLQGLFELSDEALLELPVSSTEPLLLAGAKAQCITWHETKEDGSHWVFVELWQTQPFGSVTASEGFTLSRGIRRPLTAEELNEGH